MLAEHYGFADAELDFITNCGIKYLMGRKGSPARQAASGVSPINSIHQQPTEGGGQAMQECERKSEGNFFRLWIVIWIMLACYLFVHTMRWDPQTPFITSQLFRTWFAFALLSGVLAAASGWDTAGKASDLKLWQGLGFGFGFLLYFLIVLAFYAGVFIGTLFAFDAAIDRLIPNADMEPVTIHPSIGSKVNRYLLLLFLIVVTIPQAFSVSKPLARWFNTNMESRLKLSTRATPEPRYFRTTVKPGGRVKVASPELESGQEVNVVVRPTKYRTD